MPGFECPGRPGGELDEPLLDMIFGGCAVPPSAPPEMHELARTLAALAGPAEPGELAGEAAALAAFRFASPAGISPVALRMPRHGSRRPVRHGSRRPVRHWSRRQAGRGSRRPVWGRAAVVAALVVTVAGLSSAAAYIGVLPRSMQQAAHVTVGAPAPHNVPRLSSAAERREEGRGRGRPSHPVAGSAGSARAAQAPAQASAPKPVNQLVPPASGACVPGPWQYQVPSGARPRHRSRPAARCPKPAPGTPYIPAKTRHIPAK